ncbi:BNR repeat-containing family member [Dyadobacter koreensis]|uniref:BNR repeat-containing family member n=1 Tax=Dyadobacter koreensis TaxID=408657 RepID=A0A1H6T4A4_9BACT|nr:BNR-4 repeat-containing protein [Dyadobacter koreensis]SEI70632.1 BNR repeat-containing family member [Dyadobacter koreensis]
MNNNQLPFLAFIFVVITHLSVNAQEKNTPTKDSDAKFAAAELILKKANGFKGIWYMNQPSNDEYVYKYSGGLATYPANHRPFAIYSKAADKTFFCFGGTDSSNSTLLHNVSYFDHQTKKIANPTILLDKKTTDAHDNPVISIDDKGYIWIFSTSHGITRPSYIHKSKKPFDITDFETIKATEKINGAEQEFNNFSYFQVYFVKEKGFIALFTKYNKASNRVIGYNTSADGIHWNEWKVLAHIEDGHYQISAESDGKIGVAFDYHPKGKGLNYRTNLHYLESADFGNTWQNGDGQTAQLPVTETKNIALVKDYSTEKLNCYLLDITFDKKNKPAILVISSKGYQAGPMNNPRAWTVFRHQKNKWDHHVATTSDNNYDMGSIYVESDRVVKIIGPSIDGPQAYNPGGEVAMWESIDGGETWKNKRQMTKNSLMNHSYVRRPLHAHADFYGIWADGNGRKPSESFLYFTNQNGDVYQLPRDGSDEMFSPILKP